MADDCESLEQIYPHVNEYAGPVSREMTARRIEELYISGLIQIMDKKEFNANEILRDPIEYWFEMTKSGRALWESESSKYEKE